MSKPMIVRPKTCARSSPISWAFALVLLSGFLGGCTLPDLDGRIASSALSQGEGTDTALGRAISPRGQAHPGKTGIHALIDPHDAVAARALLARGAEKTLDVQYYIWRGDITGTLLFDELRAAAERGVRVRLLLDDNGTAGLDAELAALDSHPNIEIRLFNPFVIRTPKAIGYLTDFMRANRRMHNKSFTADNQATIIGGRNVGDEYFGATDGVLFADLDVLAIGSVVADVSSDFDRYWASDSSYPIDLILPEAGAQQLQQFADAAASMASAPAATEYVRAIRDSAFIAHLLRGDLAFEWAATRMVSDDPAKGLGQAEPDGLLTHQLGEILGEPQGHIELVSPYFVPTAAGTEAFVQMAERGVQIRVLTNSLAATDVAAVHAGYAKRRKDLLEAGIRLYELRRTSPKNDHIEGRGPFGSSASSLHAKTFAVDQTRVFVGSFNFDPRSANLNTELGFVIESPSMALAIEQAFDKTIPASSYEVRLNESAELYWLEQRDGQQLRHDSEPETSVWKRAVVSFLSSLPIEWML
ncbi:phospholipase D family protein [Pseudomonas stutzeri]|uniref:phospholipase D family protein n=1 Tax=Stutzerimonas stutzeri TaxID=316 RepID=UPI00210A2C28|nr:phospholipase D family protein [Stutzerimonas stutzeri]MCQ4309314.1 phospholipase D family protein [Stutzerimonas stutzeri]